MMPEMDGIEVLKKIRELEKDKETKTPIIALTANAMEGSKEEYLSYGFNDYLSKPVNGAALKNTLKKYLFNNESSDKIIPNIEKPTNIETKEERETQISNQNEQREFIEDKKEEQSKIEQRDFIDEKEEPTFIEDKKEHINSDLINSFEKVKKIKESGITNLDDYSSALEELKKIAKSKGFTKLTQRAYVHFLKSKDKDIDYLNEHFIDLENEYNNVI